MARLAEINWCHRDIQRQLHTLSSELVGADIPLRVYETVRSPFRQAALYAQGRTVPGKTVTRARAWESFHQYGLAADFVFLVDGKWTWDEPETGMWDEFHRIAKKQGLSPLAFEKPHVQLGGVDLRALMNGDYELSPWTMEQAEAWGPLRRRELRIEHPGAPPLPEFQARPAV